ncbi:Kinesin-like protein kif9 [Nowakowskiella sp. JEL0407]|nr:Kinesin-like protein kif9 [Nowakowskiella sp. JEL0407]
MEDNTKKHVQVVVRSRPSISFAENFYSFSNDNKSIHIHQKKSDDAGYINNQLENWDFSFDHVFHNASQETIYEECAAPILKNLLQGYNGTILAYGQTGAGKTFTMTGATENYKHRGIIPRVISNLFHEISSRPQYAITVRISYLEIYNETMIDLLSSLSESSKSDTSNTLSVVDDKNGSSTVKGLTLLMANNEEEALSYLFEGETNRSISEHQLNKNSTRSHCIFTIHVESRSRVESSEKVMFAKLNLVDLAGSERLSKTQTNGVSLKEAMYINKSLSFLEQVIIALADKKREHIPFRQSKLTNVLRDALGGNCNTLMIANIWGEKEHLEETISTLRFATRMMCVTTSPEINVQYDPMALLKKYEREIKELKQELSMHDTISNRSHIVYEPYSEQQRFELQKQVKAYLDGDEDKIDIVNLRHIRELLSMFRVLYKQLEADHQELTNKVSRSGINGIPIQSSRTGNNLNPSNSKSNDPTPSRKGSVDVESIRNNDFVGEIEGAGFAIGNAAANVKFNSGMGTSKKDKRKSNKGNYVNNDDNEKEVSIQIHPAQELETLPPLPGQNVNANFSPIVHQSQKNRKSSIAPVIASPPDRAEEFENFKRGKGLEMTKILNENKAVLKEKKKAAKELAENINELKKKIDATKLLIDKKRIERAGASDPDPSTPPENIIIDEEEYAQLNTLQSLKNDYRAQFEQLKSTRSDLEYCSRLVDQCRQKLLTEFETWFESVYGNSFMGGNGGNLESFSAVEDVMDVGEKFEKLQLEKMSFEDPDSLPFYNARKNTERRIHKVI